MKAAERKAKDILLRAAAALLRPKAPGAGGAPDPGSARRILVVRQDRRLGNALLVTPFLRALRRLCPQAHIGFLASSAYGSIYQGCPWVDELILFDSLRQIRQPWSYPADLTRLGRSGWEITFDLSGPEAHSFNNSLAVLASRAPHRIGFARERSAPALSAMVRRPRGSCHYSLVHLLLLSGLGLEPEPEPPSHPAGRRRRPDAKRIVVNPWARGAKQWQPELFAGVACRLASAAPGRVIVIAGPDRRADLAALSSRLTDGIESRALRTLGELEDLLEEAGAYLGCDAGPLHLAAAMGVPTVSIFTSSNPLRYAPLGEEHLALVAGEGSRLWVERESAGPHAPPLDPGAGDDAAFTNRLCQKRPRLEVLGKDAVDAVAERVLEALEAGQRSGLDS